MGESETILRKTAGSCTYCVVSTGLSELSSTKYLIWSFVFIFVCSHSHVYVIFLAEKFINIFPRPGGKFRTCLTANEVLSPASPFQNL